MWGGLGVGLKSFVDRQQTAKYKSTTIKTLRPACTATSSKDRQISAYSTSLTILVKLVCPDKKKINTLKWPNLPALT